MRHAIGSMVCAATLVCTLASVRACGAVITLPDVVAKTGGTVISTLLLASEGQQISGLQFDIAADTGLSVRVLPAQQVGASSKLLNSATQPNGSLRVLIVGINRQPIQDGELLRTAISVASNLGPGVAHVRITNASATDPDGNSVAVRSVDAAVQIQAAADVLVVDRVEVVNAASLLPGPVSPGEIVTVLGGPFLAGAAAVLFNGTAATILSADPVQVQALVPFTLQPHALSINRLSAPVTIEIRSAQGSLALGSLKFASTSPGIFTQSSSGVGPGVVMNEDSSPNSFSNPAAVGSAITVYGTGFGSVGPTASDGSARTVAPVSATIGGIPAEVIYAGTSSGLPAGTVKITARIPTGIQGSPTVPLLLTAGTMSTQAGVTISIK